MGGRLDSTNVVSPLLSIITMIGYDHMDILGNSIEEIASEKAGIIKSNIPIVTNEVRQEAYHVIENVPNNAVVLFISYIKIMIIHGMNRLKQVNVLILILTIYQLTIWSCQ